MPNGYMGKVLWVDLSSGKIEEEEVPDRVYEMVLSGMGLSAWMLMREIPKGADPMGPENVLGLVTGVLTGTGAQMTGRWMAVGKSPLTGGWGDANGGGQFAPAIKRCGYDGIFVKGASAKPVYLKIVDGKAELLDASHLWGLDTVETEAKLREESGKKNLQVACIGPAGEKRSLLAGIVTDQARIAARSGLGAVMGSKNLKAVALAGKAKIEAADPETIGRLSKRFGKFVVSGDRAAGFIGPRAIRAIAKFMRISPLGFGAGGPAIPMTFRAFGTIVTNVMSAEMGDSPVKNWKGAGMTDFPMSTHSSKLSPDKIIAVQEKRYHCYSCPIGCGGILELTGKTRFNLGETHKPEYETCSSFGSLILNHDLDAIFLVNDLLNRAGMDTIGAGAAVAFAMECFEQGILGKDDLGGLDLTWGNAEAAIELTKKLIAREGIGDLLADGTKRAAARIGKGAEAFAMQAGGQELPMHDGRLDPGFNVAYSMEPTPARHTNYCYMYLEMFALHKIFPGLPAVDMVYKKSSRLSTRDREIVLSAASKFLQIVNGAGSCLFAAYCGPAYPLIQYLNAATGWNKEPNQYLEIGERIQHLRQAFNVKHGRVPGRDFKLPGRVNGDPPLAAGPLKGIRVPIEELNRNFARAMNWDESGRPLPERLRALGLEETAEELESIR
jgi:aldehyde:ferredoxin oxidoreductase